MPLDTGQGGRVPVGVHSPCVGPPAWDVDVTEVVPQGSQTLWGQFRGSRLLDTQGKGRPCPEGACSLWRDRMIEGKGQRGREVEEKPALRLTTLSLAWTACLGGSSSVKLSHEMPNSGRASVPSLGDERAAEGQEEVILSAGRLLGSVCRTPASPPVRVPATGAPSVWEPPRPALHGASPEGAGVCGVATDVVVTVVWACTGWGARGGR